jgi:hypothetical protein
VLVILMPGKKVPECRSSLRPSEKELPKWRSGMCHHKNTPVFIVHISIFCFASILQHSELKFLLNFYCVHTET